MHGCQAPFVSAIGRQAALLDFLFIRIGISEEANERYVNGSQSFLAHMPLKYHLVSR
jgi:hypothetical protein